MLRCAGEAVSLYSGSFKDLRVLSFMYESFKGQTRVTHTGQTQWTAKRLPLGCAPFSDCVAPWWHSSWCWHLRRYLIRGGAGAHADAHGHGSDELTHKNAAA